MSYETLSNSLLVAEDVTSYLPEPRTISALVATLSHAVRRVIDADGYESGRLLDPLNPVSNPYPEDTAKYYCWEEAFARGINDEAKSIVRAREDAEFSAAPKFMAGLRIR